MLHRLIVGSDLLGKPHEFLLGRVLLVVMVIVVLLVMVFVILTSGVHGIIMVVLSVHIEKF